MGTNVTSQLVKSVNMVEKKNNLVTTFAQIIFHKIRDQSYDRVRKEKGKLSGWGWMVEGWGPSVGRRDSYSPTGLSAHAPASLISVIIVIMFTFIALVCGAV